MIIEISHTIEYLINIYRQLKELIVNLQEFQEHIQKFLEYVQINKNCSEHTYRAYTCDLRSCISFWKNLEENELCTNKKQIQHDKALHLFVHSLYKKSLSSNTIARKLSCLRSLNQYLEQQDIKLDVALNRPRIIQQKPPTLTVEEITHLLDNVRATDLPTPTPYRDKTILELLYATGIKCSELIDIRIADINIEEKAITIRQNNRAARVAYFGSKAKRRLLLYMQYERQIPKNQTEFVLLNYKHEPLTTRSIQRICTLFKSFLPSKKEITPRILRNSFAAHMLHNGTDKHLVQKMLGLRAATSIEKHCM